MKSIKIYLFILLSSVAAELLAITLPSQPFFGGNELYEGNNDEIEYSIGTKIRNINIIISTTLEEWGNQCMGESFGEEGKCMDCCDNKWAVGDYPDEFEDKYNTCLKICDGTPLPLGSALWFLPFILAYTGIRIRKNNSLTKTV